jgi:hypothetical protein
MTRIAWDQVGERTFETGVDRGVLYLPDGSGGFSNGVPWNGLTGIEEDRSSAGSTPYYIDGIKYIDLPSAADYAATLKAFTYPNEFLPFDGIGEAEHGLLLDNQVPQTFGMSYRTRVGNDVESTEFAYQLHILYNLTATPTNKSYETQNASVTPMEFSWGIAAGAPQIIPGFRPTAHAILDSRKLNYHLMNDMENLLYGTEDANPHLPSIADLVSMIQNWVLFELTDNGDGTWTVTTPYEGIISVDPDTGWFEIDEIDAVYLDSVTYEIFDTP